MIASILFFPAIKIGKKKISVYWLVTLLAAIILLSCGFVQPGGFFAELLADTAVNPLKILVLFISMTVISVFLDEAGFFAFLAGKLLKKGNGIRLFICLYAVISILTVFTSNDIVILTFTPFICYFAKNADIDPVPYLIAEFTAANTWSTLLVIGNPTNVYLAGLIDADFYSYFKIMLLPTAAAGIVSLLVLLLLFKHKLTKNLKVTPIIGVIKDKALLICGLVHLGGCIVMLAISSYLNLEMWYIALSFALSLTLTTLIYKLIRRQKPNELIGSYKRAPWQLIPFLLSMLVMVSALNGAGVTSKLAAMLAAGKYTVFSYLISAAAAANLVNNIPMSVWLGAAAMLSHAGSGAIYAVIVGSNLGALLTPVGALAGMMWSQIIGAAGVRFSFLSFIKYGLAIALPSLLAAGGALYLALALFGG